MYVNTQELRSFIRGLLEDVAIGPDGKLTSDDDSSSVTIELVDEYIKKHSLSSSSRYGNAKDHILPLEAKEYFDHIGFKDYKVVKVRSRKDRGPWQNRVQVEFWYGD